MQKKLFVDNLLGAHQLFRALVTQLQGSGQFKADHPKERLRQWQPLRKYGEELLLGVGTPEISG